MVLVLRILALLVLILVVVLGVRSWLSRSTPPAVGLAGGALRACGDRPNCVCSCDTRPDFQVEALPYAGDRGATQARLEALLRTWPRTRIERRDADFWHVTQQSALFRFIDDLELHFDDASGRVQLRSASRVGYSDLGVNRKRVEALRSALAGAPASSS